VKTTMIIVAAVALTMVTSAILKRVAPAVQTMVF
jgi:hypothetical protein